MKKIFVILMAWILVFIACSKESLPPQGRSENSPVPKVIVEKEKVAKEQPLPPEVKIKLRKDGKDNYSWELSGSDVEQVLKVNERLRKQLGGEQVR